MIDGNDSVISAASHEVSLADRPVAYSVISELLRIHGSAEPRSAVRRIFGARPVHADAQSWFSGAHGELEVGEILARLGPEWLVLHAIPVGTGNSDIDHVLVGPAGVYTINTKRHRGKRIWVSEGRLLVAGQKTDHLRNSRHEASRAAKLLTAATGLPVEVHPLLTIVDSGPITFKQRPRDVSIMDARALPRWLKRLKPVLSHDAVERIAAAAVRSHTWHPHADLTVDPTYLDRFRALDQQVVQALRLRILWAMTFTIGVGVLVIVYLIPAVIAVIPAILSTLLELPTS